LHIRQADLAPLRDIFSAGFTHPPVDLHRVRCRPDRSRKFSQCRRDNFRPVPMRPPFMLIQHAIQRLKKRRPAVAIPPPMITSSGRRSFGRADRVGHQLIRRSRPGDHWRWDCNGGAGAFEPLNRVLDKHEWGRMEHRAKIVAATLGEFGGAIGAASNAMQIDRGMRESGGKNI